MEGPRQNDDADIYGNCVSVADRYEKLGRLGEGTYGIVYQARDRQTHAKVALKRCIPHHESSDGFPVTTLREIQSLRLCAGHPHIVQLALQQEVAVSRHGVFLVFEYCEHDMANLIDFYFQTHAKSPFSLAATKTLLQHLLAALDHVHSHYIIHRDVKLTNLLYTHGGILKLADFGLSRPYAAHDPARQLTPNVASLWYRPPELLLGATTYSQAIDIWAAGCILAELLSGQPLVNGKTEEEQITLLVDCIGVPHVRHWPALAAMPKIRNGQIRLPTKSRRTVLDTFGELSSAGLELQSRLLHYDSLQRWTAYEGLQSSFFVESPVPTPTERMPRFPTTRQ